MWQSFAKIGPGMSKIWWTEKNKLECWQLTCQFPTCQFPVAVWRLRSANCYIRTLYFTDSRLPGAVPIAATIRIQRERPTELGVD